MTPTPSAPFPTVPRLPEVSRDQMIQVDRLMIEEVGISLVQMMENAGRSVAVVAREVFLGGDASGKRIAVLAGSGGNGGGAITAARRLAGWGAQVSLGLSRPLAQMAEVPAMQAGILGRMEKITTLDPDSTADDFDLIIDGLVGYSLGGQPRGRVADFITWANARSAPILSLDVPSGYDAALGAASAHAVVATATATLALPKLGMVDRAGMPPLGRLFCCDISVPPWVLGQALDSSDLPQPFSVSDLVEITNTTR